MPPFSFQLLSLLPSPLLAAVASHLPLVELLLLQRCSSALRRLRVDESYMTVAWSCTTLRLSTSSSLLVYFLKDRIVDQHDISLRNWREALPALTALLDKRAAREEGVQQQSQQLQQLRRWVTQPQPTQWIQVRRSEGGVLCDIEFKRCQRWADEKPEECKWAAVDEELVEVLTEVRCLDMQDVMLEHRDVEVHCRLVLQACPYLQHLSLNIDTARHVEPSHEDTFALVPRLRSLDLHHDHDHWDMLGEEDPELLIDQPPVDFERMLDSLPCLTALRYANVYISISDLLDIASHSTLQQLHIEASGQHMADKEWLGDELFFPLVEESGWRVEHTVFGASAEERERRRRRSRTSSISSQRSTR